MTNPIIAALMALAIIWAIVLVFGIIALVADAIENLSIVVAWIAVAATVLLAADVGAFYWLTTLWHDPVVATLQRIG